MGMKKIYDCNICRDPMPDPIKSFGLNFSGMKTFTLDGYGCTDGVHICYGCARQLANHFKNKEIIKLLEEAQLANVEEHQ